MEKEKTAVNLNEVQTKKLLEHAGVFKINHLALRMLITRLKMVYRSNPGSLAKNTTEINNLFGKFPKELQLDYDWIITL
jgi:hypothetical protein